jgi:hypothetical protein
LEIALNKGSITTEALADKAVTAAKLADDVTPAAIGAATAAQGALADSAIQPDDLSNMAYEDKDNYQKRAKFVASLPTTGEAGVQYYVNTHGAEIPYYTKFGRVVKTDTGYTLDVTAGSYITLLFEKSGKTDVKLTNISSE